MSSLLSFSAFAFRIIQRVRSVKAIGSPGSLPPLVILDGFVILLLREIKDRFSARVVVEKLAEEGKKPPLSSNSVSKRPTIRSEACPVREQSESFGVRLLSFPPPFVP